MVAGELGDEAIQHRGFSQNGQRQGLPVSIRLTSQLEFALLKTGLVRPWHLISARKVFLTQPVGHVPWSPLRMVFWGLDGVEVPPCQVFGPER